jgi:hypothetical protein
VEHARGTQLGDMWQNMKIRQKMAIVDEAVAIEKKFFFSFILVVRKQSCSMR